MLDEVKAYKNGTNFIVPFLGHPVGIHVVSQKTFF